jgi:uncharacterized membrane protein YgcG
MRLALGATGIAALSALTTAIVLPPQFNVFQGPSQQQAAAGQQATDQLSPDPAQVQASVIYIQLQPGQTAPPGAVVIDASGAPASTSRATAAGGGGKTTGGGTTGGGGTTSGGGAAPTPGQPVVQATAQPTPKPTPKPTPVPIQTTQSGKVK